MAANLSNIAFFDISEDQFKNFIPGNNFQSGTDYYGYLDSDIQGDEYLSTICNFAIQIDVDKKITLGRLGEFFMKSNSFWNLLNKHSDRGQGVSWYESLKTNISNIETLIGPQNDVSDSWDWNDIILKYNNLIELIYNITGIIGGLGDSNDPAENYKTWNTWNPFNQELETSGQDILGSIQTLYKYLTDILGSNWFEYTNARGGLNQRVTELENYTGIPITGASGQTSLKKQIADINTALGKKSDEAGTDTVYGRLNQLESEVLFKDQIFNFDLSQAYKHVYNLGGSEVPGSGIYGDTPITKEILVLEKNHRYLLNNTSEILSFNNLVSSVRGLTADKVCYGIPSRNEAPIPRCEFKNLQDGDIAIIDSGDYYYLAGFYYMNSKFISQGYQGMCFPSITRTDTYSSQSCGLDFLSLALSLASVSPSSIYPWTLNGAPLDLTKTHFKDNMITSGTQLTFYKFSQDSEKVYSDWVNLAFPYTITIKAKDLNGDLHYFIDLNYKIGPLMQHVFDSNPKPN